MSTLAIELNDAGITSLGDGDRSGSERCTSPGYAVVDGATVLTGVEAFDQSRLKPRRAHHRFWSELDTQPIGRPFPAGLSTADLAHAHLSEIWSRVRDGVDRVVVALPGSHSEHQMGLILGIAQACEMPVEGIIDAAVAGAATVPTNGHLLHLHVRIPTVHQRAYKHCSRVNRVFPALHKMKTDYTMQYGTLGEPAKSFDTFLLILIC